MFYTGGTDTGSGVKQRIGLAISADLYRWRRHPASPVLECDARWYELMGPGRDEGWRDPWVFPDPGGDGWHMLVTSRSSDGAVGQRGVVGHARSADLVRWRAQPPLSLPDTGFWHLEVQQVEVVDGHPVLIFSCMPEQLSGERRRASGPGAIWCVHPGRRMKAGKGKSSGQLPQTASSPSIRLKLLAGQREVGPRRSRTR